MRLALLIASLMACLLAAPLAAFGAEKFEVVTLGGAGRVTDRVLADFDGDGRPEIVLLDGRRASIYRAADGDWDASVPWRFDLAADAICFDVGQVDAIPETREIVLVTPDGVRVHAFRDGRPSPRAEFLIRTKTLASRGPEDALFRRRILHDLDGDGLVDLVLPTARGFALHHQARDPDGVRPGRWTAAADGLVPFRLHATFSPGSHGLTGAVRGSTGIPDFHVLDFDGDGRRDFALDDGRKLTIHRAGEDGRIRPTEPTEIDLAPLAGDRGGVPRVLHRDLTGDGIPELLVAHRDEGRFDLFLGGTDLTEPARSFALGGRAHEPWVEDLDGDGRPDLVLPVSPVVTPVAALRLVATGVSTQDCHIFLNTGAGKDAETGEPRCPYREKPDLVREFPVKIRMQVDGAGGIRTTRTLLVEFRGEFTGDGRRDLVRVQGGDRVVFHAGTAEGIYREDAWLRVGIPDTSGVERLESEVLDLDGDGRDDLLIEYRTRDRKSDRLVLLLSRGGKK